MDPWHPFDAIAFDGDGSSAPYIEPDVVVEQRAAWQAMNAADVPTLEPH